MKKARQWVVQDPACAGPAPEPGRGPTAEERWRLGFADPPKGLDLYLTDACDLRCSYCPIWGDQARQPRSVPLMDLDRALAVVAQLAPSRPFLRLLGGEALLHPEWDRLVRSALELGSHTIAVSNGMRLEREAERIVRSGLWSLALSVDFGGSIHDAGRGAGSFERIRAGLRALRRVKDRLGSETPLVEIYSTLHEGSYRELEGWIRELADWGIHGLRLQHLIWCSPADLERTRELLAAAGVEPRFFRAEVDSYCRQEPPAIDGTALERQMRALAAPDLPFEVEVRPELSEAELARFHQQVSFRRDPVSPCTLVDSYAFIDPRGRLFPCLSLDMGSVWERPFEEVWNGRRFRAFRRLLRRETKLPVCHRCPAQ